MHGMSAGRPVISALQIHGLNRTSAGCQLVASRALRWGELMGLRKTHLDLTLGLVRIDRAASSVGSRQIIQQPKTEAGRRTIALPMWLVPELEHHFADYSELLPDGRVFVSPSGITPSRANFSAVWARALKQAGLSGIHVHDPPHREPFRRDFGGLDSGADGPDRVAAIFDFSLGHGTCVRPGLSGSERMTGIEPALSAWERDPGCAPSRRQTRSSWFFVVGDGPNGADSYTRSYPLAAQVRLFDSGSGPSDP